MASGCVTITYGNHTDWEVRLVLSAAIFVWLVRGGHIWRIPNPCTPAQLLEYIKRNERWWKELLEFANIHPAGEEEK